ncbi:MAG: OmpA family protein [Rubripirellula sp.]|nr:OmpA family protein [Rubripirellula sp.]
MDDESEEIKIPEWVVTFGDMMSLLLTFFIMLVSLSEIKDDETYQKLVDSVQREFGYSRSADSLSPGKKRPRKTEFTPLATTGRAKRKDTTKGGVPVKAPDGEEPKVRIVRPGQLTAVGAVIFFDIAKATLTPTARAEIKDLANKLRGKPQKIEIRGHVSPAYAGRVDDTKMTIQLGFERALNVRQALVDEEGINPARCRVSSVGDSEPIDNSVSGDSSIPDPRVEVFMLNESFVDPNKMESPRKKDTSSNANREKK